MAKGPSKVKMKCVWLRYPLIRLVTPRRRRNKQKNGRWLSVSPRLKYDYLARAFGEPSQSMPSEHTRTNGTRLRSEPRPTEKNVQETTHFASYHFVPRSGNLKSSHKRKTSAVLLCGFTCISSTMLKPYHTNTTQDACPSSCLTFTCFPSLKKKKKKEFQLFMCKDI